MMEKGYGMGLSSKIRLIVVCKRRLEVEMESGGSEVLNDRFFS